MIIIWQFKKLSVNLRIYTHNYIKTNHRMKSTLIAGLTFALAAILTAPAASAETDLPANQFGLVAFGSSKIKLTDPEATRMEIPTHARLDYSVSAASWLKPEIEDGKLILNVDANNTCGQRSATLSVRTAQGKTSEITVTQNGMNVGELAYTSINALRVRPSSVTASVSQPGEGANLTIDDNTATFWHSPWSGFNPENQSEWPLLTFRFSEPSEIATARYFPRSDGQTNGNWEDVAVFITTDTGNNPSWTRMNDEIYHLKGSSNPYDFKIECETPVTGIRFQVRSGSGNFASCAEMEFYRVQKGESAYETDSKLFADKVLSGLKPGVKQADVDKMTDPFLQALAQLMLKGTYKAENMISTHEPLWDVETLSEQWNAPGKYYDRCQGATGVVLSKGKYAVVVDGIPEHLGTIPMRVMNWYVMPDDPEQKAYATEEIYALANGVNVINRTSTAPALAYICNYDTEGMTNGTASPITAHIIGGGYNGVLSNTKTNAEMQKILDNAIYPCIDLIGSRVHSVWEVNAIKNYAKDQYVRYINVLDQLIIWEHRLLGFEKYNRVPPNKTLAFVNYDYYMYQGGRGVTFKYDTQRRVCSPDVLMNSDDDAIWGLSHEWGHQHQMKPYFCWTGMAEVSNNIFSAYNVSHMGYPISSLTYSGRYPKMKWTVTAQRIFLTDIYDRTPSDPKDGETKTANSDGIVLACRNDAATAAKEGRAFAWSSELKKFAQEQPTMPTKRADDAKRAINAIEAYSSGNGELIFAPYINMMYFFMEANSSRDDADARPDLMLDLFEALRQNDNPNGSEIEKKGAVDKYELLASIFNNNRTTDPSINKTEQFKKLYPNSVWVTRGYLPAANSPVNWTANSAPFIINLVRKASRLTGYNLWDYFERWGVFTVCALEQGDYGIQYYVFTEPMYDEFRDDMKALEASGELRPLPESLRQAMSVCPGPSRPKPVIPNDRPLTADEN